MDQLVDRIARAQWRVSSITGLGSILFAVLLAWLLARNDIATIHQMIRAAQCTCKTAAASNTNQVTINADAVQEKAIRDVLKHRGEIE